MTRTRKRLRRKAGKQKSGLGGPRPRFVRPRTVKDFFAMSKQDQDLWNNVGQVVTELRAGNSLAQASRKFGVDPHIVQRLAAPALRKLRNGRWAATKYDHLLRVLAHPSRKGMHELGVRDSREASVIGRFWSAVERYQTTGDDSALRALPRKYVIDANGKRLRLLTNLRELDRLASAGVLSFETIYGRSA
jgi:hypothetical protein